MRRPNADIWVLTETWLDFEPQPGGAMPSRLVAQTCHAQDLTLHSSRPADRRWVGIWSRLPAWPLKVSSDPERMACIRVELPQGGDVLLIGTVLPWRADRRQAPRVGREAFCHALQAQAEEWGRLWGSTHVSALCVAGDFNQEFADLDLVS